MPSGLAQPIPFLSLLMGDDTISRERRRQELAALVRASRGEAQELPWDLDQGGVAQFVERVLTPSLFGGVRLFTLRHAEGLRAEDLSHLAGLLERDLADEYVVLEADEPAEKGAKDFQQFVKRVEAAAKKGGSRVALERFARPRDWEVARWLSGNAQRLFGRTLALADAEHLVDLAGYEFDALRSELQKVDLFLPAGAPFSRQAIAEVVEGTREMAPYELAQALGRRDTTRALQVVEALFGGSFYAPLCLSAMFRHFWALYRIRLLQRREPLVVSGFLKALGARDRAAQDRLGVQIGVAAGLLTAGQAARVFPVLVKSDIVKHAAGFTEAHLRAVVRWLRDFDCGVKTGRIEATRPAFEVLCCRIVAGPAGADDLRAYRG